MENTLLVYIKGERYDKHKVKFDGNEDFKPFELEFETFEDMANWVAKNSNLYSIKVQFFI